MWSAIAGRAFAERQIAPNRLLILGDKKTGKTSIAFKMAYEAASEGSVVLFVCLQNKIRSNFPLMVSLAEIFGGTDQNNSANDDGSQPLSWSPIILSRIMLKYISNAAELKQLCASIHMLQPRPQCVIIDDFTLMIDPMSSVSRQDLMFVEVCQTLGKWVHILFIEY